MGLTEPHLQIYSTTETTDRRASRALGAVTNMKLHRAQIVRLTPQQMLENTITYFIIDGKPPAIKEDGTCSYWTSEGNKCGVGCQFDDALAKRVEGIWGGTSIGGILTGTGGNDTAMVVAAEVKNAIGDENRAFAGRLQSAHDSAARAFRHTPLRADFRTQLWTSLVELARDFKLVFQPVHL